MTEAAENIVKKLEDQLAQSILYLGAIDALAKKYRDCKDCTNDVFLFDTVYSALWDAVIVRIGTIWDRRNDVASLSVLATALKKLPDSKAVTTKINESISPEMTKIANWRNEVVAHTSKSLNEDEFDKNNAINASDIRSEIEKIEKILASVNKYLGRSPIYLEVLKEDAFNNAQHTLDKLA